MHVNGEYLTETLTALQAWADKPESPAYEAQLRVAASRLFAQQPALRQPVQPRRREEVVPPPDPRECAVRGCDGLPNPNRGRGVFTIDRRLVAIDLCEPHKDWLFRHTQGLDRDDHTGPACQAPGCDERGAGVRRLGFVGHEAVYACPRHLDLVPHKPVAAHTDAFCVAAFSRMPDGTVR